MQGLFGNVFRMYRDGFANMRLGRTLWFIVLLKLFILFCIVKPFFFPDILQTRFNSNDERAAFVFAQLSEAGAVGADRPVLQPAEGRPLAEAGERDGSR